MTHADDGITAPTPGGRLRALLAEGELIVAPGGWEPAPARPLPIMPNGPR